MARVLLLQVRLDLSRLRGDRSRLSRELQRGGLGGGAGAGALGGAGGFGPGPQGSGSGGTYGRFGTRGSSAPSAGVVSGSSYYDSRGKLRDRNGRFMSGGGGHQQRQKELNRKGNNWRGASYGFEQAATQVQRTTQATLTALETPVKIAANFEDQMGRVTAKGMLGKSMEQVEADRAALTGRARQLGRDTRYTATEVGEGMEFLAMAGFKVEDSITSIEPMLALASVGNMELSRAADIATNVMGGFGLQAEDTMSTVDALAASMTSGNVTLTELGDAMKYSGAIFKKHKVDLATGLSWMDVLGDAGIKGSQAGTSSREIMARIAAPTTSRGPKALKKLGVSVKHTKESLTEEQIAAGAKEGDLRDVTQIMGEIGLSLASSGKGTKDQHKMMVDIFGKRAATSALILSATAASGLAADQDEKAKIESMIGSLKDDPNMREFLSDQGLSKEDQAAFWDRSVQKREADIRAGMVLDEDGKGIGMRMAEMMDDTTKGGYREFKSALEDLAITVGDELLPMLTEGMKDLKPVIKSISAWAADHPNFVKALGALMIGVVTLGTILVPVLHGLSTMAISLAGVNKALAWRQGRLAKKASGGGIDGPSGGSSGGGVFGADARGRRQQRRANRRANRRAAVKKGMPGGNAVNAVAAAAIGWEIGTAIGTGINEGVKLIFGRDLTAIIEEGISKLTGEQERSDALEAKLGGRTGVRGVKETEERVAHATRSGQLQAAYDELNASIEAEKAGGFSAEQVAASAVALPGVGLALTGGWNAARAAAGDLGVGAQGARTNRTEQARAEVARQEARMASTGEFDLPKGMLTSMVEQISASLKITVVGQTVDSVSSDADVALAGALT